MRGERPSDYMEPDWKRADRVHDWRNYIPEPLRERWTGLSEETRFVAACMAQQQADGEEWD